MESQGIDEVINIGKNFGIDDINLIKPGIGETTRVLLRRIPWKVLIDERYKEILSWSILSDLPKRNIHL